MFKTFKKNVLILGIPFLVSCGTTGAVKVETVEVLVEVPVQCVKKGDIPAEPPKIGDTLTGDAAKDIGPISISALKLRAAFGEALALLQNCVID